MLRKGSRDLMQKNAVGGSNNNPLTAEGVIRRMCGHIPQECRKIFLFLQCSSVNVQSVSQSIVCSVGVQGVRFYQYRNAGLSGIWSVRYRNEQKCGCRNQSGTGIRGPSPVPECSGTGLRYRMLECRCRRHQPRCRCQAIMNTIMKPIIFILAWSFCTKSKAVIGFGPKKVHLQLRYNISSIILWTCMFLLKVFTKRIVKL